MKLKLLWMIGLLFFSTITISMAGQTYQVSVNDSIFHDGDTIRNFELRFNGAWMESFEHIPEDGQLLITNWTAPFLMKDFFKDWEGMADWSATVGAGRLSPDFFKNFMKITVTNEKKFKIEIMLAIGNDAAGTGGAVTLTQKDLVLTPVSDK
jgi:hypothetical protein